MEKSSLEKDKSSRWAFTAYEHQYQYFKLCPPGVKKWGWNTEVCPDTKREHYQGYILLNQGQRFSWMRKNFPGVHVEIPRNWEALLNYCKKAETRKEGTMPVEFVNDIPTKFQYLDHIANELCNVELMDIDSPEDILKFVQAQVALDIQDGKRGVEWIASNPDWKVVWKQFGKSILLRARKSQTDGQTDNSELISPVEYTHALLQQEGTSCIAPQEVDGQVPRTDHIAPYQ